MPILRSRANDHYNTRLAAIEKCLFQLATIFAVIQGWLLHEIIRNISVWV